MFSLDAASRQLSLIWQPEYMLIMDFYWVIANKHYPVYNNLGYQWASSLLGFLTPGMVPFP